MSELRNPRNRPWWGLLIFGILLHLSSMTVSDYGLDTHLHLAALESNEDGTPDLEWGDVRPEDPLASNPDDVKIMERGWWQILDLYPESVLPLAAFLPMMALIGIGLWLGNGKPHFAALLSLHPSFIFATGRLYPESTVALAVAGIAIASVKMLEEEGAPLIKWALLAVASVHTLVLTKGLSSNVGWILLILLFTWILLDRMLPTFQKYSRNPLQSLSIGIPLAIGAMVGLSFTQGGSFAAMQSNPFQWMFALFVAFGDGVGLYILLGFAIWPFLIPTLLSIRRSDDSQTAFLTVFVVSGMIIMTMWIASLWVYEAIRWDVPLWKNMITMGNNGRYLTALSIPVLMLLNHFFNHRGAYDLGPIRKTMFVAILLVLPLSMLAGLHGQTMWTDEAGEVISSEIQEGQDFLYIDDESLAMHWLYTFRLELDPDSDKNITGHWRSPDSNWEIELAGQQMTQRGNLDNVEFIILAPNIDTNPPQDWILIGSDEAPFLNGGGEWKVFQAPDIVS